MTKLTSASAPLWQLPITHPAKHWKELVQPRSHQEHFVSQTLLLSMAVWLGGKTRNLGWAQAGSALLRVLALCIELHAQGPIPPQYKATGFRKLRQGQHLKYRKYTIIYLNSMHFDHNDI